MSYSNLSEILESNKVNESDKVIAMYNFMNMLIVVSDKEAVNLLLSNEIEEMYEILLNTYRTLERFVESKYGVRS